MRGSPLGVLLITVGACTSPEPAPVDGGKPIATGFGQMPDCKPPDSTGLQWEALYFFQYAGAAGQYRYVVEAPDIRTFEWGAHFEMFDIGGLKVESVNIPPGAKPFLFGVARAQPLDCANHPGYPCHLPCSWQLMEPFREDLPCYPYQEPSLYPLCAP